MAGMKSWLEKIKNQILKKDLDDDLLESRIQSEYKCEIVDENEIVKELSNAIEEEKELPALITPTSEDIKQTSRKMQEEKQNKIQREEAMRVNVRHEKDVDEKFVSKTERKIKRGNEMLEHQVVNIKNQHFKPVPECRGGTRIAR